jgi:uncharacterized damage-inducible protein DinB
MDQMQTGADYADALEQRFAALLALYEQLTPEQIEHDEVVEGWTPKTLLAHVAFWDDFQTRRMQDALRGVTAERGVAQPVEDNDRRLQADRDRSWEEILAQAQAYRSRMIGFALGLDEATLTAKYREGERTLVLAYLLQHMINHTVEHTEQLQAYVIAARSS